MKFIAIFDSSSVWPSAAQWVKLREDSRLLFAYGWHPKQLLNGTGVNDPVNWERLNSRLGTEGCVALGEVGLDYSRPQPSRQLQKANLPKLLRLAVKRDLPIVIHCRDQSPRDTSASDDCLTILKQELRRDQHIHRHCFNGSFAEFKKWREAFPHCYFGITGLATLDRVHPQLSITIDKIPDDRLLLETDAPHLKTAGEVAPHNSPYLLDKVAKYVAEMRSISLERLFEITARNTRHCYRY